jgi:hypothetical protein
VPSLNENLLAAKWMIIIYPVHDPTREKENEMKLILFGDL